MQALEKLKERQSYVALMIGKNGSGKSSAIASFAKEGRTKVYDLDKRSRGILGCDFLAEEIKNIDIEYADPKPPSNDVWAVFENSLNNDVVKARTNRLEYKNIVLESATTIADIMLLNSKRLRGVESKAEGKTRGVHQFTQPDDYNYVSDVYRQLVYEYLFPLRCNVFVSAWVVDEWARDTDYGPEKVVGCSLNTTRKLAERIPGYFDEIYYFSKVEEPGTHKIKFYVQFEGWLAKTCIPQLRGLGKVDITGKSFYNVLQEKLNVNG